jgi:hypothetical protein
MALGLNPASFIPLGIGHDPSGSATVVNPSAASTNSNESNSRAGFVSYNIFTLNFLINLYIYIYYMNNITEQQYNTNSLEPVRQDILTMHTLLSTMSITQIQPQNITQSRSSSRFNSPQTQAEETISFGKADEPRNSVGQVIIN